MFALVKDGNFVSIDDLMWEAHCKKFEAEWLTQNAHKYSFTLEEHGERLQGAENIPTSIREFDRRREARFKARRKKETVPNCYLEY